MFCFLLPQFGQRMCWSVATGRAALVCRDTGAATDNALITVFKSSFKGAFADLFSHTFIGIAVEKKLFVCFKPNHGFVERATCFSLCWNYFTAVITQKQHPNDSEMSHLMPLYLFPVIILCQHTIFQPATSQ